jgi:hypothetical protein
MNMSAPSHPNAVPHQAKARPVNPSCSTAQLVTALVQRRAWAGVSVEGAVAELRKLANGRGDLLARQAGIMRGACQVRPCTPASAVAVELLTAARAEE